MVLKFFPGLGLLCGLTGCVPPQALGITGPSGSPGEVGPPGPSAPDDTAVVPPGLPPDEGQRYAPSVVPLYGTGTNYYGYD